MERKIRVFLVEDDKCCCFAIRDYILGMQDVELVGMAHDGIKALELMPMVKPDVVLIDLSLPEIDGFGVIEKMKTMSFDITPIIIVTTANSRPSVAKLSLDAGAELIMLKPYKVEDLVNRIRNVFKANLMINHSDDIAAQNVDSKLQNSPKYKIMTILNQYGIPSNRVGYQFLVDALLLILEEPDALELITKRVYPQVAQKHHTTHSNVERGIRHSIEVAWRNTGEEILTKLYGNAVSPAKGRPTNAEFIANISQKLQLESISMQA